MSRNNEVHIYAWGKSFDSKQKPAPPNPCLCGGCHTSVTELDKCEFSLTKCRYCQTYFTKRQKAMIHMTSFHKERILEDLRSDNVRQISNDGLRDLFPLHAYLGQVEKVTTISERPSRKRTLTSALSRQYAGHQPGQLKRARDNKVTK